MQENKASSFLSPVAPETELHLEGSTEGRSFHREFLEAGHDARRIVLLGSLGNFQGTLTK